MSRSRGDRDEVGDLESDERVELVGRGGEEEARSARDGKGGERWNKVGAFLVVVVVVVVGLGLGLGATGATVTVRSETSKPTLIPTPSPTPSTPTPTPPPTLETAALLRAKWASEAYHPPCHLDASPFDPNRDEWTPPPATNFTMAPRPTNPPTNLVTTAFARIAVGVFFNEAHFESCERFLDLHRDALPNVFVIGPPPIELSLIHN